MGVSMVIKLTPAAAISDVRARLQGMGLWTHALNQSDGDAAVLVVEAHSSAVPAAVARDVPGVDAVFTQPSGHPKIDEMASKPLEIAGVELGGDAAPVLMAGPCSVESEEQIHLAAAMVAARGATFLRGGAFKPRTSPYAFSGRGYEALQWLRSAADAHDLAVVTEVMSEAHVDSVAAVADLIQVGSRNMQNFALLRRIGAVSRPVLLKRGMAATIEDWLLAGEHLLSAGATGVIFCERGIQGGTTHTRNLLDLSAVSLLKYVYRVPVIVDPSHATGRRDLVVPMSRAAIAAGADGLLIEVHPDPTQAQSDGPQAVRAAELDSIKRAMIDVRSVLAQS